jgi:DNA-directed RNA polymerase specialized sigma subunit
MNDALKTLHNKVNERDFSIFYNSCFKGQNRNDIATALNVDASTVTRNRIKVLKELSIILYPDINILEMFA